MNELTLISTNPMEMQQNKDTMIAWCEKQRAAAQAQCEDLQYNLDLVKNDGFDTKPFARHIRLAKKRVKFYMKMKAALQEGYYLIPSMPTDTIAIRTDKLKPRAVSRGWRGSPALDQGPSDLDVGLGRYVSPQPLLRDDSYQEEKRDGKLVKHEWWTAEEYCDVALPPDILDKPNLVIMTQEAMQSKIFDRIGYAPQRYGQGGDPMIIGEIMRPGSTQQSVCFLIAWYTDLNDL